MKCPHCHQTFTTSSSRKPAAELTLTDIDALSESALYAYRKRTAPAADLRFLLANDPHMSDERRAFIDQALAHGPTAADATRARDHWRARDRQPPDEAAFWTAVRAASAQLWNSARFRWYKRHKITFSDGVDDRTEFLKWRDACHTFPPRGTAIVAHWRNADGS
mgnify:CR=1 FL=1